jgi:hypothetical protein
VVAAAKPGCAALINLRLTSAAALPAALRQVGPATGDSTSSGGGELHHAPAPAPCPRHLALAPYRMSLHPLQLTPLLAKQPHSRQAAYRHMLLTGRRRARLAHDAPARTYHTQHSLLPYQALYRQTAVAAAVVCTCHAAAPSAGGCLPLILHRMRCCNIYLLQASPYSNIYLLQYLSAAPSICCQQALAAPPA